MVQRGLRRLALGVLVLGLGSACPKRAAPPPTSAQPPTAAADPFLPSAHCPGRTYAGVTDLPSCPAARPAPHGRWAQGAMFSVSGTGQHGRRPVPPAMARHCRYEWVAAGPGAAVDVSLLPASGQRSAREWLRPDCQVVTSLGELSDAPQVWSPLFESTLRMVGVDALPARCGQPVAVPPLQVQQKPKKKARAGATPPMDESPCNPGKVRVAVVDSAVEGYDQGKAGTGRSPHGRAVGRVVRAISCPEDGDGVGPCIGMVSNHLALPRVSAEAADPAGGGYFGTQVELAGALWRAVEAWREHQTPAGDQPRLVVNLSVGWDPRPEYGGHYPDADVTQLPGPVRAVHAAMTHAACQGALVIAAAGNHSGRGSVDGPMFPAAWEQKPAPTVEECAAFEGPGWDPKPALRRLSPDGYRPLVHAVGGVDARDWPLGNARPAARARLAAYGDHVSVRDASGHTRVLTGTSLSTAAVSGVAAAVWGFRPSLTASELMQLLYEASPTLSPAPGGAARMADFCLGGACGDLPIRRVSLCSALARACATPDEQCPPAPPQCTGPFAVAPYGGARPSWPASEWSAALATVAVRQVAGPAPCSGPGCSLPAAGHPTKHAVPWVEPQPGWSGCDVCGLVQDGSGKASLYVSVAADFPAWTEVRLSVRTAAEERTWDLSAAVVASGPERTFEVRDLELPPGAVEQATLSFGNGGYATSEPILFW